MNKTYYLQSKQRLGLFRQAATADFWNQHWRIEDLRSFLAGVTTEHLFLPRLKTYLPPGSRILEGGCGRGQIVKALTHHGYLCSGIDFADETVRAIHAAMPDLKVQVGDVRDLPIRSGSMDGYISAGVIEHFWDGYGEILAEMRRVLRVGGYLFLTFPYASPLRRLFQRLHLYPSLPDPLPPEIRASFYQFYLPCKEVCSDLAGTGFRVLEARPFDGIKGWKDEVRLGRAFLQRLYDTNPHPRLRRWLDRCLVPVASHGIMIVAVRES